VCASLCVVAGDELLSDSFPYKEIENGVLWEVEGKVRPRSPALSFRFDLIVLRVPHQTGSILVGRNSCGV